MMARVSGWCCPCLLHAVKDAVGKFAVGADGFVLLRQHAI